MKRLIRLAAGLYPRRWRDRYGDEFAALLDKASADPATACNVLQGALAMQVHHRKRPQIFPAHGSPVQRPFSPREIA